MGINKEAKRLYDKAYRERNKEKYKQYCIDNADKISTQKKKYRQENPELIKKLRAEYSDEKMKIAKKKHREKNKDKIAEYMKEYRKKYLSNNVNKLHKNISNLISLAIKNCGYTKKSRTFEILGCTIEEFKAHLESKFEPWMTWDNHGLYNGQENYGWDIDHIIPVNPNGFIRSENEILKLNHHTNLQPLCSYKNRYVKKNNYD